MSTGQQREYLRLFRRRYPFVRLQTLTCTAAGRRLIAAQLGCGSRRVLLTGAHHANESITAALLWELLRRFCEAVLQDGTFGGKSARALFHQAMLYCVPLVNPDGVDLVAGEIARTSPEYLRAQAIAEKFPDIAFPSGWKANLQGVDLNLNYPASWEDAKRIKAALGYSCPAPRDFPGLRPLDQPEAAALAAYTCCIRPDVLLSYHTQGRVIYPGYRGIDPPGAKELAEAFSKASGYAVEEVPEASSNAGFKDWFLLRFNRPGFTIEAGLGENPLHVSQLPALLEENEPLLALALSG